MTHQPLPHLSLLPDAGAVVADKYVIGRVLGAGAMGRVVEAEHKLLERRVAIKFLSGIATNALAIERFVREARIAQSLQSEHVVRVYDLGVLPNGLPYTVMELLEGKDLSALLQERGRLSIAEAVDFTVQACSGLAEAHSEGIVHRDIKPSNLFLTQRRNGTPLIKVVDFGISKLLGSEGDSQDQSLTSSVALLGSPLYMSPEQVRSSKAIDHRSDVWSLGVTLYSLLKGEAPFDGEGIPSLCAAIVADAPKPLVAEQTGVPPELWTVIRGALAKRPEERIQSAVELALALAPFGSEAARLEAERAARQYGTAAPTAGSWRPELAADETAADSRVEEVPAAARVGASSGARPARSLESGTLNQATSTRSIDAPPTRQRRWPLVLAAVGGVGVLAAAGLVVASGFSTAGVTGTTPAKAVQAAPALEGSPQTNSEGDMVVRPAEPFELLEDGEDAGADATDRRASAVSGPRRQRPSPKQPAAPTPNSPENPASPDKPGNASPGAVDEDGIEIVH